MKQTYLWFVFNLWLLVTPCTLIGYYIPWVSRTRIPGRRLGRVPLLKRFRRRNAINGLAEIREQLKERPDDDCPELEVLTDKPLVDQVHAHATWAQLSRLFLAAPGMLASVALAFVVSPLTWRSSSLWAIGVYLTFVYVSAFLTCVDIWAVRNADSAGTVTVAAVGVLESFTTRADKAPAKSTRAAWQSQLIEQLCTALVRRAHRESIGAVPGSRSDMVQDTARVVCALRHRAALVHGGVEGQERQVRERELSLLICGILKYSSRPRTEVVDFRVVDTDWLADVPDPLPEATEVPSPKARVLVPLLFMCALAAVAAALGVTGAVGEFTPPIVIALAMAAAPLARRFGVTVLDTFAEPPSPLPASRHDESQRAPDAVRRAA
jgi:hypothetical protein